MKNTAMKPADLKRSATLLSLVSTLVADGEKEARFAIARLPRGMGVTSSIQGIAAALGVGFVDLRMSMLTGDEMEEGKPAAQHLGARLDAAGDAIVLLTDCDGTPAQTLRDAIETIMRHEEDHDGEPRALMTLLVTSGSAKDVRQAIKAAAGLTPVVTETIE